MASCVDAVYALRHLLCLAIASTSLVRALQRRADARISIRGNGNLPPQPVEKVAGAIASFFGLAARSLPLIPKAERQKFIVNSTETLPEEFKSYREALLLLAEQAPEVHALNARDVIITPGTGRLWIGGDADTHPPGSDYKV